MNNVWLLDRKIDATRVEQLDAHAAADYAAQLAVEDAAFVLATASASASAGVLRVLLSKDKELTMAILTVMNKGRAQELVAVIGPAAAWLERLPEAAEAIADHEDQITGEPELGQRSEPLALATPSKQGTQGFYQSFTNGMIHWSETAGAQSTRGAINQYYIGHGGSGSRLGFPLTPDVPAGRSPFGTEGSLQRFEFVRPYRPVICSRLGTRCGATVYWSQDHGAHATWGSIGQYYEHHGGTGGPLGFPIDDEAKAGPSRRESGSGTVGWSQRFEGGMIYYTEKTKAVFLSAAIAAHHGQHGGATGDLGFPVSPELPAAQSPFGTTGQLQRFEARLDYGEDIWAVWPDFAEPAGATVYASEAHGVHCVGWGNGHLYEKMGGTRSWLGYPRSDETDARSEGSEPWCTIQNFEGGAIYYKEEHGSVPVPLATTEFIGSHEGLHQRLGFPVKAETLLAPDTTTPAPLSTTPNPESPSREQLFEHGLVTIRNGSREAWLRAVEHR